MPTCHTAIYARVSSEHQAEGGTVASQIAALEARLAQDGLQVTPDHRFVDDGYSGSTLKRPALERLRDAVASGLVDRLYVHSPDRLARRYAYQVLLIDESGVPASRSCSSTALWANRRRTTCCSRSRG